MNVGHLPAHFHCSLRFCEACSSILQGWIGMLAAVGCGNLKSRCGWQGYEPDSYY